MASVFGKGGRAETPTDPAPLSMIETVITLRPRAEWRRGLDFDALLAEMDGAVKTPGRIEQLSSRTITLLQAIAKAGGATERANLKGVQILRRGEHGTQEVVKVNLKRVRHGKDPDPVLQDGDLVVVPETFF